MRRNTKQLVVRGVLIALSVVLVYLVHFPVFPIAPFLEYDPADIPIIIGTFMYGPGVGLLLTVIASAIQGLTVSSASGIIGIMMHIFATGSLVLTTGNLFKRNRSKKGVFLTIALGTITMTISMVIWNLIFTPLFLGAPIETVLPLMLPAIVPFNMLKAGVNTVVAYLIYRRIKGAVRL